jgi:hypothetical protein
VSDASQYHAFKLRDDLADPDVEFDFGVIIALPDGSEYKVGEALLEGDGLVITSDVRKLDSLRAWGAVEATALPDDFVPPADPVDTGPTLVDLKKRAGELDIDGRSSMNKDELAAAIAEAEAQGQAGDDSGSGGAPDDSNGSGD